MRSCILAALLCGVFAAAAQTPRAGKNAAVIRGQPQDVYFYPASSTGARGPARVIFLPGDGGWRGFAVDIARQVASAGYDVYGWDTKRYLMSFTAQTTLSEADVMSDFRLMADWVAQGKREKIALMGWSEGAGLALLGAAPDRNKDVFAGLVALGLPDSTVLGWRRVDDLTYLTRKPPKEPTFRTEPYMLKLAPLPLVMIHSSRDEYVTEATARQLFAAAREPKRFELVKADNHRYDGNREEFFRVLREALVWIGTQGR